MKSVPPYPANKLNVKSPFTNKVVNKPIAPAPITVANKTLKSIPCLGGFFIRPKSDLIMPPANPNIVPKINIAITSIKSPNRSNIIMYQDKKY